MNYSHHAIKRCQQRGIPHEVVEAVQTYGRRQWRKGCQVYYLGARERRRLRAEASSQFVKRYDKKLDVYVVVSPEDRIVTVGHKYHRFLQ
ncbi:DUF4258 domain-containing protein [Halorhodospira halophila]|uniref:DUF4258 domain-containing protein n=1 Tax=Halorhodospira halophila TaxID=1053 RepID=UPI0019145F31|nr:DUF4258 domain-containing protein [Halorhodospira halophila]MBK5936084.1 hypothetical protein [Halorhodospira halophila]